MQSKSRGSSPSRGGPSPILQRDASEIAADVSRQVEVQMYQDRKVAEVRTWVKAIKEDAREVAQTERKAMLDALSTLEDSLLDKFDITLLERWKAEEEDARRAIEEE